MKLFPRGFLFLAVTGGIAFAQTPPMVAPATTPTSSGPSWHAPAARFRLLLQRGGDSPWPARVGAARVGTAGLDPSRIHFAVFGASGTPVGSQVLWAERGQPVQLLFDTSRGETNYFLYAGPTPLLGAPAWRPDAGVVLETRRFTRGPMDNWAQFQELWKTATPQGRSIQPNIYLGINPHGPVENVLTCFRGTIKVDADGEYDFATISDDASFLFVDGALVAQWPGWHDAHGGRRGQHHGTIKLRAGPHSLDYYHGIDNGEMCAEAAWRNRNDQPFQIITPETFGRIAAFETVTFELPPINPGLAYFEARPLEHSSANRLSLVTMQFNTFALATNQTARWTFDDGTTGRGHSITHLFPRPGIRTVKLDILTADRIVATVTDAVNASPRWLQREEFSDEIFNRQRNDLMTRDFTKTPLDDLLYALRFADIIHQRDLLTRLGAACWPRAAEITGANADIFLKLAFHYQTPPLTEYAQAEKSFRAVLARNPPDTGLKTTAQLRLAELLLRHFDQPAELRDLLSAIPAGTLDADQRRLLTLLRGDAARNTGDIETARRAYHTVADTVREKNPQTQVRINAQLETVRAFFRRGDTDDAGNLLAEIEWNSPLERLSVETGFIWLRLLMARKEFAPALARCRALLALAEIDNDRADTLGQLIEIQLALADRAAAGEAFAKLVKEFPYTEAAARAKDKWGRDFTVR